MTTHPIIWQPNPTDRTRTPNGRIVQKEQLREGAIRDRTDPHLQADSPSDEATQLGIKLAQILTLFVFVAWALTVLGARIGWISIMVITVLLVAKPFLEALASSSVVAGRPAFSVGDGIGFDGKVVGIESKHRRENPLWQSDTHPGLRVAGQPVTIYAAYEERRSAIEFTVALQTDIDAPDTVIRGALAPVASIRRVGTSDSYGSISKA